MCATMHGDTSAETAHDVSVTTPIVQVPEARSVVVLYVRFTTGEVRRSHGFCIDSKQGIVVGGAHTLPRKLSQLAVIEVHLYHRVKRRFEPCFVAEPLAGGVSPAFQHGGMDLALLRITHLYVDATTSGNVAVAKPADIEQRLSGIRIGTSGYEPRDPVSIIRFPIIEADNSRGCKSKCGRVMACEGSRLHLDFTELQDGDSGSLVINGAGEALGFLMGRAPDRNCEQCRCFQPVTIPDNSVYYAQLLSGEEPQAFIQNVLQWSRLGSNLSTVAPVPWGEYKIKQRIRNLEQTRGLQEAEKRQVVELVALFEKALEGHRTKSQEEQKQIFEAAQSKANDAIDKLESVRQAVILQCKPDARNSSSYTGMHSVHRCSSLHWAIPVCR